MTRNVEGTIKQVLEKIIDEYSLGASNERNLALKVDELLDANGIDRNRLAKIIGKLREKGLIVAYEFWRGDSIRYAHSNDFDTCAVELPKDFQSKAKEYIAELDGESPLTSNERGLIYFDKEGNLWHGDKSRFCYKIRSTSRSRYEILKYLVENDGFQLTSQIASALEREEQKIRVEVGKMKRQIEALLRISDLIESDRGAGYRINPTYKIITE